MNKQFIRIAKKLYTKTKDQEYFTADDLYRTKLVKSFEKQNQIGPFFKTLRDMGCISECLSTNATHERSHGHQLKGWKWEVDSNMEIDIIALYP